MATPIPIPTLIGGVSRVADSQRPPQFSEEADNVTLNPVDGVSKRAGSEFIAGEAADDSLDVSGSATKSTVHVGWINRDANERFFVIVNPTVDVDSDDMVQVFDLNGVKQTVNYGSDDPRAYIKANFSQGDARRRLRMLTTFDTSFILNRTVITALKGGAITYRNGAGSQNIRNRNSDQNVPSWNEFDHPPTDTRDLTSDPVPDSGNVDDDAFWYAREDDVGQPQGFYAAVSSTQPPWFARVRTEEANSRIDEDTMPVRMDFDGTDFTIRKGDWTDRLAGDSGINPGPTFIGNALSDMAYYQNRLCFASGERLATSQAGKLFNLWINSSILQVDSDPVDIPITQNRTANIDFMVPFREALVLLTNGSKQIEVRHDGPFGPNTVTWLNASSEQSVDYVGPALLGSELYFLGERDFSHVVYEYLYDPGSTSNTAKSITAHVEGYIPAPVHLVEASESHGMLFMLNDTEPNVLYNYKVEWEEGQKRMSAWSKWIFGEDVNIWSVKTYDNFLYMLLEQNGKLWLERISIGAPEQDVHSSQSMGYSVRLDRKQLVQGVYDENTETTTWTLPFEDESITEIVLGPTWDAETDDQRLAGVRLTPTVTVDGGETVLSVLGQYQKNAEGVDAPAYVGRPYKMRVRLSRPYVRDDQGQAIFGTTQLLSLKLRFQNSGYFRVEVTPRGRFTRKVEYLFPRVGSTLLDAQFIEDGSLFSRIMASADNTTIDIVNDSPLPCTIVDGEFQARFVPQRKTPTGR